MHIFSAPSRHLAFPRNPRRYWADCQNLAPIFPLPLYAYLNSPPHTAAKWVPTSPLREMSKASFSSTNGMGRNSIGCPCPNCSLSASSFSVRSFTIISFSASCLFQSSIAASPAPPSPLPELLQRLDIVLQFLCILPSNHPRLPGLAAGILSVLLL